MPVANLEGGVRLSYHVFGQGVPIVFIPPPVVGCFVFYQQAIHLSQEFQVILFDLRGHGRSAASDRPLNYSVIAHDLHLLLNHLGVRRGFCADIRWAPPSCLNFYEHIPSRCSGQFK